MEATWEERASRPQLKPLPEPTPLPGPIADEVLKALFKAGLVLHRTFDTTPPPSIAAPLAKTVSAMDELIAAVQLDALVRATDRRSRHEDPSGRAPADLPGAFRNSKRAGCTDLGEIMASSSPPAASTTSGHPTGVAVDLCSVVTSLRKVGNTLRKLTIAHSTGKDLAAFVSIDNAVHNLYRIIIELQSLNVDRPTDSGTPTLSPAGTRGGTEP
jgi:hypothetical protein